jgi:predicted signal transduction protein with EAL and GGDEF domain
MRSGHEVPVAVNVSTRCLLDTELPAKISAVLGRHGVPSRLLRLEITESTLIADPNRALSVLNHLASLGIRLPIDELGHNLGPHVVAEGVVFARPMPAADPDTRVTGLGDRPAGEGGQDVADPITRTGR